MECRVSIANWKTDRKLGLEVHKHLIENNVETPFEEVIPNEQKIADLFKQIMQEIGLNMGNDSLIGTPNRVTKLYTKELFYGLSYSNFPKCTTVQNEMEYDEMVTVNYITVSSNCEHHFVAIDGVGKVSYIPNKVVLGLSKINRIVAFFSKRPQIQERLTEQIYFALSFLLKTENVAVQIKAVHFCVKSRGVQDVNSYTITTKLGGNFKDKAVRSEFLNS